MSNVVANDGGAGALDAGAARLPPNVPADFRTRFAKLNRARFLSRGHLFERFAVDLYANAEGKQAYDAELDDAPVGAMLVKEHFDRAANGDRPGPLMAMEKQAKGFDPENGDWRYTIVSARGETVVDGKSERCAGCHHDAPHDHVFRVTE